jgi:hypothetical protein
MPQDEIDALLARFGQMVVGAIDAEGWPIGTIAATEYAAGTLSIRCRPGDPVATRLDDDPHVCCLADEHGSYSEIRGVIVHGTAVPVGAGTFTVVPTRTVSFDFGRIRS